MLQLASGVYCPPVFVKVPLALVSPPHTISSVPVHAPEVLSRAFGVPMSSAATHDCPPV